MMGALPSPAGKGAGAKQEGPQRTPMLKTYKSVLIKAPNMMHAGHTGVHQHMGKK